MLYKKNIKKELDSDLFKKPTSEYRGAPFWSWNCKMTPDMVNEHIEYFKQMGFGGFHIHVRCGLDNEYLGEEFMSLIKAGVDKAKSVDMLAWLYDEDRWPSGFAGGLVTKTPEYRARALYFVPASMVKVSDEYKSELQNGVTPLKDFSNECDVKQAIKEGRPYFIAAFDIVLDKNGFLTSGKLISRTEKAKGEKWYAFCDTEKTTEWYNNYTYIDSLSKKCVGKFIETTHEKYKECVGDEFDKTVPAIFTDEPQFVEKVGLDYPTDKKICKMPWTEDFPDTYKKTYGEDIVEHIPEIFWDLPNGEISTYRYYFNDHICERFVESFFGECGKWCDKNGIKLTGHMFEEPTLRSQTWSIGEAMRAYKHFGYPGIDMLGNLVELTTAKQTQSVVRQYGKEAMTSEIYGVTNWDYDFRGHKFQGDWQAAMGVTIRVHHLAWASMEGESKRDYPASIFYQSPWYKEYSYVEDHFARLNTALTRGTPCVKIGVIHPIESFWIHCGPNLSSAGYRNQMDENFNNFIKWMLFSQLDFDYISESLFPEECEKGGAPLCVGKMKYDAIVVPALETIRKTTLDRLKEFSNEGGKLIFMGECPKYVDAVLNEDVKELYDRSVKIPFEKNALIEALKEQRDIEISYNNGIQAQNYIYQMRDDGTSKWLFVANAIMYSQPEINEPKELTFKIKGEFEPILYDTLNGETKKISYNCCDGYTYIPYTMHLNDSLLLKLNKSENKRLDVAVPKYEVLKTIVFKEKVKYEREEPNVLLLDMAEYSWDDRKEFEPLEELLRIDGEVRKKAGIPPKPWCQPWTLPKETPEHTVTLRFTVNSETTVENALFAIEKVENCAISYDGKEISNMPVGYFTDKSIKTIALPTITAGKHTIVVTMPIAARTFIEWCYILGNFNVKVEGCEKTILAPTDEIGFGSVVPQGLSFYGGNIKYICKIDAESDCSIIIHLNNYRGSLVSVKVDSEDKGKIVYAPYNLRVDGISKGTHTVEFILYGNRYNSFGALHNANLDRTWISPDVWRMKGDEWSYEYIFKNFGIMTGPKIKFIK